MPRSELSAVRLRELLHYDPLTGVFTRLVRTSSNANAGATVGVPTNGYLYAGVDGKRYRCHRLAWLYQMGAWPENDIDHINGVRDDNRWENLRHVTRSENMQNQHRAKSNNISGFLGVSKDGDKWAAKIKTNEGQRFLGSFNDAEQASAAYLAAKRTLHVPSPIASGAGAAPDKNGRPTGKSGLRGVKKHRRKWVAEIRINHRTHFLGLFASPELAYAARLAAENSAAAIRAAAQAAPGEDEPSALEQPVISEEMRHAGLAVYDDLKESYPDYLLVEKVYDAMWKAR